MEAAFKKVHAHEHAQGGANVNEERQEQHHEAARLERINQAHIEEHLSELSVGQGQGPETQVGRGVGHSAEHKLNSLDHLMDHQLTETASVFIRGSSRSHDIGVKVKFIIFGMDSFSVHKFFTLGFGLLLVGLAAEGEDDWLDAEHGGHRN